MRHIYFVIAVAMLLFSSCYDDKGNYDYVEINEIEISGFNENNLYEKVAFVDNLQIAPQIKSNIYGNDLSNYEFEWKIIPVYADNANKNEDEIEDYIVSNEKDLDIPITLLAGTYDCFYIVKDKISSIEWRHKFTLRIKSLTSEGWMVLCDTDGEARLDIVFNETPEKDLIAYDIWRDSDFKLHNPQKLIFNYSLYGSALLCVCEEGTYNLTSNDLIIDEGYNIKWSFGAPPEKIYVQGSAAAQFCDIANYWVIVDEKGDAYWYDTYEYGGVFGFPTNRIAGQEYFKAAPFVGVTYAWYWGSSMMMYDATNRRFLEVRDGASFPSVMQFKGNTMFAAETGRDMVHLESTKGGFNYAILKDPEADRYYFYCIEMNYDGDNFQQYYGEIIGADLDKVKHFACHHMNTMPYLFYSTDDKIYQFDMAQPSIPAKEALSFNGETIQTMKFTPYVAWEAYQDWERERNYRLLVGTNVNEQSIENCGIMRTYNIPTLMGDLVKYKEHTGFGKIVDITYKERGK